MVLLEFLLLFFCSNQCPPNANNKAITNFVVFFFLNIEVKESEQVRSEQDQECVVHSLRYYIRYIMKCIKKLNFSVYKLSGLLSQVY